MSSPATKQPDAVADKVLKRAEVSRMARHLQNHLGLARFKIQHRLEHLPFDEIEPIYEEELRRKRELRQQKRFAEGDMLSDSSSSASDLPYSTRALMSSPLKAGIFSDAITSSNGSTGHRKRIHNSVFDDNTMSSPSKRFRISPTAHKSFTSHSTLHHLTQSSPIKPNRQQHFTTSTGPDISFFDTYTSSRLGASFTSPNFAVPSDDDDDLLPVHSFPGPNLRSSPPSTPPTRHRNIAKKNKGKSGNHKSGEEGAELLLHLAASPSPANPRTRTLMEPPSTPPPKHHGLPSSMVMTTPGGESSSLFPNTPSQPFNFADFVHMTPSPAQKPWKTPRGINNVKTPLSVAQRRLTYDHLV